MKQLICSYCGMPIKNNEPYRLTITGKRYHLNCYRKMRKDWNKRL